MLYKNCLSETSYSSGWEGALAANMALTVPFPLCIPITELANGMLDEDMLYSDEEGPAITNGPRHPTTAAGSFLCFNRSVLQGHPFLPPTLTLTWLDFEGRLP